MTIDMEFDFLGSARRTLDIELKAVSELFNYLDDSFINSCRLILNCSGRIVVIGMGKSGHIGKKIAATLASTGTPAFFVHPGEASHGDMGMITSKDVVIALSNSGETTEVISLLRLLKRLETPLISITGNPKSTLACSANFHLNTHVPQEACPMDLAPTASTTAALVMGDALAIALLEARGFTSEDFAASHPGGSLGRRLLLKVEDIMHKGPRIPVVSPQTKVSEALLVMTTQGMGMTTVQDQNSSLVGVFTDGDLRRAIDQGVDIHNAMMTDVITGSCHTITPDMLAYDALQVMEDRQVNSLVVQANGKTLGVLSMHDLFREGLA